LIKLECVGKEYDHRGRRVTALDEASFEISKGDLVSVVGPSGSGKSTLLGSEIEPRCARVLELARCRGKICQGEGGSGRPGHKRDDGEQALKSRRQGARA